MIRNDMVRQRNIVIVCSVVFCFFLAGCEPLRKKFTRKKKDSEIIRIDPVLEPVDYPPMQILPQARYKYYFSMWRIWEKDLIASLNTNENDRRITYLFGEMYTQLKEMDKWIIGEKKEALEAAMQSYDNVRPQVERPEAIRDERSVMRKLERNAKDIRTDLSPDMVNDFLIPAQ